jgi:hypothetical protein
MTDVWEWRYNQVKEWINSEIGKWKPVEEYSGDAFITTLTVVVDRMERIAKEKP